MSKHITTDYVFISLNFFFFFIFAYVDVSFFL